MSVMVRVVSRASSALRRVRVGATPMTSLAIDARSYKLDGLSFYYMNAKKHDLDSIMESLQVLGQYKPIVVNVGSDTGRPNEVLIGNGTLEAARKLGWSLIDCQFVDVDEQTARRINLNDNRMQERAGYDVDKLLESLGLLDDLVASGYSEADVARMLTPYDSGDDPDDDPQPAGSKYRVVVECSSEDHQQRVMQRLEAEGLTVRALGA